MPEPKLLRIVKDIAARVESIKAMDGFYTDTGTKVIRGDYVFNEEDTPASAVFLQSGENGGAASDGVKTDPVFTIRSSHAVAVNEHAEDLAIKMMADIHKAVEIKAAYEPGPSDLIKRVKEESWQIVYPDNASSMVSVEVNYSFSYSRKYGED